MLAKNSNYARLSTMKPIHVFEHPPGHSLLHVSVGLDGDFVSLWKKSRDCLIQHWREGVSRSINLPNENFSEVISLGSNGFVLFKWSSEDQVAWHLGPSGELSKKFSIGPGELHVQHSGLETFVVGTSIDLIGQGGSVDEYSITQGKTEPLKNASGKNGTPEKCIR